MKKDAISSRLPLVLIACAVLAGCHEARTVVRDHSVKPPVLKGVKPVVWEGAAIYRDLAYGPRGDGPQEGKNHPDRANPDRKLPDGHPKHTHRTGQFCDVIVDAEGFSPTAPVYVNLHGGAWCQDYDKDGESMVYLGEYAKRGFVVVNANYIMPMDVFDGRRRPVPTPGATFKGALRDIDDLLTWIKTDLLSEFGVCAGKVVLAGGSAGAHLVTLYAYDQGNPTVLDAGLRHDLSVGFVVDVVGPTDLACEAFTTVKDGKPVSRIPMFNDWQADRFLTLLGWLTEDDLRERVANGDLDGARKVLFRYSPSRMITASTPPTILAYCRLTPFSETDGCVPVESYHRHVKALQESGVPYRADIRSWKMHGWLGDDFSRWVADCVEEFAGLYL